MESATLVMVNNLMLINSALNNEDPDSNSYAQCFPLQYDKIAGTPHTGTAKEAVSASESHILTFGDKACFGKYGAVSSYELTDFNTGHDT
jgi:hypothetical protein